MWGGVLTQNEGFPEAAPTPGLSAILLGKGGGLQGTAQGG